ncbi:MAG: AI-2E family transporter [Gammaproteobacteria bacterium]|jgi:predicted PurR-regulated permease PerM|nr:AI-2E family transporter [Gammaproteobacteria bacterium]
MTNANHGQPVSAGMDRPVEVAIRLGLIFLIALWCLMIVRPFIDPIMWGIVIAVAAHPLYAQLESRLGHRRKLAATLFTFLALLLIIVPVVMLSGSMVDTVGAVSEGLKDGTLRVPPPPDGVADWPLVGEQLHALWAMASTNLEGALNQIAPQLKSVGNWLVSAAAGAGAGILKFLIAIVIAGVLLVNAEGGRRAARAIGTRFVGPRGPEFADLAGATVRSVAQGVLGVAFIQSILAGIGLLVADIPGAGIWALLVLLLAIVQLPPLLILAPIAFYAFGAMETLPAVLFTIYALFVSMSDTFLKPMLLGRGVDIPMLVILLGAIGGMMLSGIIGLFVGSVVLALGYKLFMAWLEGGPAPSAGTMPAAE